MPSIDIAQRDADALIAMEKRAKSDEFYLFPADGQKLVIPLVSTDRREHFSLDITRSQIKLTKGSFQARARQVITLLRLDLDGAPHRNPDDTDVPCPHLHIYREGFGDKLAVPAPTDIFKNVSDLFSTFEAFMGHCDVATKPKVERGLFS